MDDDLDAVLENINLLIEDMEDNINHANRSKLNRRKPTATTTITVETPLTTILPTSTISTTPTTSSTASSTTSTTSLSGEISEDSSRCNGDKSPNNRASYPIIRHDFANESTTTLHELDTTAPYQNTDYLHELFQAKEALEDTNHNKSFIKDRGKRMYCSAENSPVLSRGCISAAQKHKLPNIDFRERTNSITPRLSLPNIDKFDVAVRCPDGSLFKAGVFRAWTSFQLAWKIAHVRGMKEKLTLVVEEKITDLHLMRTIEDHEIVHKVVTNWAPNSQNTLEMNERVTKYDVFNQPEDYLPFEMFDIECNETENQTKARRSSFFRSIMTAVKVTDLKGWVFVKDFDKKKWRKRFLRIKNTIVYLSDTDEGSMTTVYPCAKSYLYRCLPEFNEAHKTPTEYSFCVIPDVVSEWHEIKCFCTSSKRLLTGWLTGFRFAKYGEQLYANFREAMTKEANLRKTNSARQSVLFRRSLGESNNTGTTDNKATLDFTGQNGRVVSDPIEIVRAQSEMAFGLPKSTKRRSGGNYTPASSLKHETLEKKAWFHGKLNREQAIMAMKKSGAKEGLFLVRESNSAFGTLVVSVVTKKGKIAHYQINQGATHSGLMVYGIEHGPQFPSLEQLIEAYHLGPIEGIDFALRKPCPQAS